MIADHVARCDTAGYSQRIDAETENFVGRALRADGFDDSEDGTGRGTPLVPVAFNITPSNSNKDYNARQAQYAQAITAGGNAPSARGGDLVAFSCKDHGADAGDISPTPRAMSHSGSHQNAGGQVAIAIQERAICENPNAGPDGAGVRDDGAAYTLEARTVPQAVQRGWAVRRLTPEECERLQGFPDGYTNIPWRGKTGAPDGPRYKALGNSFAVNVVRWIGRRIQMVEDSNG